MTILFFAGDLYYPSGGAEDLIFTSDNLQEAKTKFAAISYAYDWANSYDTETLSKITYETLDEKTYDASAYMQENFDPIPGWQAPADHPNQRWYISHELEDK